ncbi:MAG: DUF6194 family protein [Micropruina sp.]
MTIDDITSFVTSLGGVLVVAPRPGDGSPEVAWGDLFFYYAPDGVVPPGQPFATLVTKDYPGEPSSGLGNGVFRVNIDGGRRDLGDVGDPRVRDRVLPHPVYAQLGWVCVVQPGDSVTDELNGLLRDAHAAARRRWDRRHP